MVGFDFRFQIIMLIQPEINPGGATGWHRVILNVLYNSSGIESQFSKALSKEYCNARVVLAEE